MRRPTTTILLGSLGLAWLACAGNPNGRTLAELHDMEPDLAEVRVEDSLDQAMDAYRRYLEEAPKSALTPEAMRRLADLKLEKEYGILGDSGPAALPAPAPGQRKGAEEGGSSASSEDDDAPGPASLADLSESEQDFERRAAGAQELQGSSEARDLELPPGEKVEWSGPEEAIELYDQILATYPNYEHNDQVLYQKARAYDELGRSDEAVAVIATLIERYPHSRYIDEVQFRRGEYYFTRRKFLDAEEAYAAVTAMGPVSEYYELALYKLGWSLYKQEMHEEALNQYVALLDYKVSTGYDFDQKNDENDERRIADTFRVISLSFSSLGGSDAVESYFTGKGSRAYEDRIYSQLGEFYLEKLRYHDAAETYKSFVRLYPLHRSSPHFSMRVVEIYEKGGFPRLVLESKKDFAARYGLQSEYWHYFDVAKAPEVLDYLKSNLKDLANHYHAQYQDKEKADQREENFAEALQWYRAYLGSFPTDPGTPAIHYQLADLMLEHKDFGQAAREYEHTAYDYPVHEQSAAAGYAAIYAHREAQKKAKGQQAVAVQREAVASTLRFVDTFPQHEQAPKVLVAAVDDLYEMKEFQRAIETGRRLIKDYPQAEPSILRSAWTVVAHASFDLASYVEAEQAYAQVLEMVPEEDEARQGLVDNLAASIYKQGEQANEAGDYRGAADHFLRIVQVAPGSEIRPVAEYDAGAALIRLEDWTGAASVLEAFRSSHPDHELNREATKQLAFVNRQAGNLAQAAEEYERVASEAEDPELRREAMLEAGDLYKQSELPERALAVYRTYVEAFPQPLELAVETRFEIAELLHAQGDESARQDELRRIVEIDRGAGDQRSDRIRYLAARSALVLSETVFQRFDEIDLVQPFDENLQRKQRAMNETLDALGALVDYEVGEVTAAATFYMAEVYYDFSQSLMKSERPSDLEPSELQDYEMVLEEEAFPFEERAISVHEKNLELMSSGVYNTWIEKSLGKLAVLMPGRYAKFEESSGLIASLERYAYRAPSAPEASSPEVAPAGAGEAPETTPEAPEPGSEAESAQQRHADDAAVAG